VDRLERLVNLVAALIDTDQPLTREEIHSRIEGYSADPAAFRRNFERDKDLLRQMGFPLLTVGGEGTANEEVGYRIPRDLYELPDPGLDESELAALRLAASAVQLEADWGHEAITRALRKLGGAVDHAADPDSPTDQLPHTPNRREPGSPSGDSLAAIPGGEAAAAAFAAVGARQAVEFTYRGERRVVDPWSLSFHRGRWYLAGFDHLRGEERLYRLDRVDGALDPHGSPGAFRRPGSMRAAPPPSWRMGDGEEIQARILVDAGQADQALAALGQSCDPERRPDGSVEISVAVTNPHAFRSFVLGFLEHAEILGPQSLREDMITYLESLLRADDPTPTREARESRSGGKV
jgi:predicted DNA-binding transcriptional regulator YafY